MEVAVQQSISSGQRSHAIQVGRVSVASLSQTTSQPGPPPDDRTGPGSSRQHNHVPLSSNTIV